MSANVTPAPSRRPLSFAELGITEVLCKAAADLQWKYPTKIQLESIPFALEGKDIVGLAETGSGKTGAFALPILQAWLKSPKALFALILSPTRELSLQIAEHFQALGASLGVKTAVIVGGVDMVTQSITLAKNPDIIIATPGRLVEHLESTKGFNLRTLKFLVMDEADRILNMDFELELEAILKAIPRNRTTFLFSATMTHKVAKLQRASLRNPVKVQVNSKYQTVDGLDQYYCFIPSLDKDLYLAYLIKALSGSSVMIFCTTCASTIRLALMLRHLGSTAVPLHGKMGQDQRVASLNKFKAHDRSILISTDVASRGLDIPHVDVVINYDVPSHSKDYIHRVGRTARAGRSGKAITMVTQYDVRLYLEIEQLIGKKLSTYSVSEKDVYALSDSVDDAKRTAKVKIKELEIRRNRKRKKRAEEADDTEESFGVRKRVKASQKEEGREKKGGRR